MVEDTVCLLAPLGHLARGIVLDNTSRPDLVRVLAYVQPLYVPRGWVVFTFSKPLGPPNKRWSLAELEELLSVIERVGPPYWEAASSPGAFARSSVVSEESNVHIREAKAYSLLLEQRFIEATELLKRIVLSLNETIDWVVAMRERNASLLHLVETAPEEALACLARWERETARALGFERVGGGRSDS